MILDYNYNSNKKNFSISYIKENGAKNVLNFNVERFKSYYKTPTGKYTNWDGSKCDIRWTERPHRFDIRNYIKELPEQYKKLLAGKTNPKLYTFDIETLTRNSPDEIEQFPEPSEAKFPITTISIVSPECNAMILGTRPLGPDGDELLQSRFEEYINKLEYFHELGLPMPKIKYVVFPSEEAMLRYFLEKIVAVVPVLAGWNSIMFDWQYIQNRCKFYYPNIYFGCCSANHSLTMKNYTNQRQEKVGLSMPCHTLVLDLMDVIENFDYVVMPIKESMSLDFVAGEMIHSHKIEYDGSLDDLYRSDYDRYVFYNGIDSLLVQLLDKKFKTMQNIYSQALYCEEMIGKCFSKIALTEALLYDYYRSKNLVVVPEDTNDRVRDRLVGAYVKAPIPGKHRFVCCNDFSGLYPSCGRGLNFGFENLIGNYWLEDELNKYRSDISKYIVVGPEVYKNKGTVDKPELGEFVAKFLDEDKLTSYRKDPNYIVSVNGCVYKNDQDYSLRTIWTQLANDRNVSKYLAKQLDATVMSDIDHILERKNISKNQYPENIVKDLKELGYEIKSADDIKKMQVEEIKEFKIKLKEQITYYISYEQGCKLLMNSCYGGSSHIAMFWYNILVSNDITASGRDLIHLMERHIPQYLQENWFKLTDLHKKLGIRIKKEYL